MTKSFFTEMLKISSVSAQVVKGEEGWGRGGGGGEEFMRDGPATLPVGGSTLNQFKALTKICTSSPISMNQKTISTQNVSMFYMNRYPISFLIFI